MHTLTAAKMADAKLDKRNEQLCARLSGTPTGIYSVLRAQITAGNLNPGEIAAQARAVELHIIAPYLLLHGDRQGALARLRAALRFDSGSTRILDRHAASSGRQRQIRPIPRRADALCQSER